MSVQKEPTFHILSLLKKADQEELATCLGEGEGAYQIAELDLGILDRVSPSMLMKGNFWEYINRGDGQADAVLIPLNSQQLCDLETIRGQGVNALGEFQMVWSRMETAAVAVLLDDRIEDAVRAAQLDFDGIVAKPFHGQQIRERLEQAVARSRRRFHVFHRYQKIRQLCKNMNRNRRVLRDKMDILCEDLVKSNQYLGGALQDMCKVYEFQTQLVGEYDLCYLLHKGLNFIRHLSEETSGAIYLCRSGQIEAHISSLWKGEQPDIEELDRFFSERVVKEVVETNGEVTRVDGTCKVFEDIEIAGVPVKFGDELLAVLILYRDRERPFTEEEIQDVRRYLGPLGQAIESVERLGDLLSL